MFSPDDRDLFNDNPADNRLPRGAYDTIYITASSASAKAFAPVIVGLLQTLYEAARAQHDFDEAHDYFDRPAMTWALDEMASMAPWQDFPTVLTTLAGDNVQVCGVFHDLSQVKRKWDDDAPGALRTNMQTTVVFPGIEDEYTLRTLQETVGYDWAETRSYSTNDTYGRTGTFWNGQNQSGGGTSEQVSSQWLPIVDAGTIRRGHSSDSLAVLMLGHQLPYKGTLWAHPSPYYLAPPWPEMLISTLLHLHEHIPPTAPRHWLPTPSLDRNGGSALSAMRGPDGAAWHLERYRYALQRRTEVHTNHRQPDVESAPW